MYIQSLHLYEFRCFRKAVLDLQYPGRPAPSSQIDNINVLLGNNGGGKSSVLRALAIAALAPILKDSGFVPYHLVRRPDGQEALLKVRAVLNADEAGIAVPNPGDPVELLARIQRRSTGSIDTLTDERTPGSPLIHYLEDDTSPAFFVSGYGATRRVETGEFSESSLRKVRGRRYQRVAGLFEDHVPLRPLQAWLMRTDRAARSAEVRDILNRILPSEVRFSGEFDGQEQQYMFEFEGRPTPFAALSDGYRAFVGWVADLLGNLADVAAPNVHLDAIPGMVLLDEVDLHLHPDWQRTVVPSIATALPRLQFVLTSHSPIVAGTIYSQNIFVTEAEPGGTAAIRQFEERSHGRSSEDLLLSSYFGMQTTRAEAAVQQSNTLFSRAAKGDADAAIEYLERMIGHVPVPTAAALAKSTNRPRGLSKKKRAPRKAKTTKVRAAMKKKTKSSRAANKRRRTIK